MFEASAFLKGEGGPRPRSVLSSHRRILLSLSSQSSGARHTRVIPMRTILSLSKGLTFRPLLAHPPFHFSYPPRPPQTVVLSIFLPPHPVFRHRANYTRDRLQKDNRRGREMVPVCHAYRAADNENRCSACFPQPAPGEKSNTSIDLLNSFRKGLGLILSERWGGIKSRNGTIPWPGCSKRQR